MSISEIHKHEYFRDTNMKARRTVSLAVQGSSLLDLQIVAVSCACPSRLCRLNCFIKLFCGGRNSSPGLSKTVASISRRLGQVNVLLKPTAPGYCVVLNCMASTCPTSAHNSRWRPRQMSASRLPLRASMTASHLSGHMLTK